MTPAFTIRDFTTPDDYRACIALQRETWGATFTDVVPPSILEVSRRVGGVAAGGFAPDGRLLGFVFGLAGTMRGRPVHWSDMLAVRSEARGTGLARALKAHQRAVARANGADFVYWTYEPLVARNAHLNFNVFGAGFVEYVRDMYPDSGSELHSGIGTDRFVVRAPSSEAELSRAAQSNGAAARDDRYAEAPLVTPTCAWPPGWRDLPRLRVGTPPDVERLQREAPDEAIAWRESSRAAILDALAAGFTIAGFDASRDRVTPAYLLASAGR